MDDEHSSIYEKLSSIHTDLKVTQADIGYIKNRAESHADDIAKLNSAVHGNGSVGLKTKLGSLTARVNYMAALVGVAVLAFFRDFFQG